MRIPVGCGGDRTLPDDRLVMQNISIVIYNLQRGGHAHMGNEFQHIVVRVNQYAGLAHFDLDYDALGWPVGGWRPG